MNAHPAEFWIRSGQAAEAARELAWFVFLVVVIILFLAWRGDK